LKYIQTASVNRTITTTQRDELLISVFFDMDGILSETLGLCESGIRAVANRAFLLPFGCS
jgi:hypothetical protein